MALAHTYCICSGLIHYCFVCLATKSYIHLYYLVIKCSVVLIPIQMLASCDENDPSCMRSVSNVQSQILIGVLKLRRIYTWFTIKICLLSLVTCFDSRSQKSREANMLNMHLIGLICYHHKIVSVCDVVLCPHGMATVQLEYYVIRL